MTARFLLDTSVLSALGPGRADRGAVLASWLLVALPRLYISTVTIFEIVQGIEKLHRLGAAERARNMRFWLDATLSQFDDRVVPLDTEVAFGAGRLADWAVEHGVSPGAPDIMIAATAQVHDLTLLTYNMKHFRPLEIDAIDAAEALPR